MQQIIVTITDQGDIALETRGFRGKSCLLESQFLKEVLGRELWVQLTPAYYQTDTQQPVKKHLLLCG